MNSGVRPEQESVDREISVLIDVLQDAGKKLEGLTAGEVDTVADAEGRALMLPSAQLDVRHRAADKEAAILDAIPAQIALLDVQGCIVSTNTAWRESSPERVTLAAGAREGINYLDLCAQSESAGSGNLATGLRSVLARTASHFAIEHACRVGDEDRWFYMTATALSGDPSRGVVVMHLDVTHNHEAADELRASELRFRQIAENIHEVFWLSDPEAERVLYVNPAYEDIWGRSADSLYASPADWFNSVHPDDRDRIREASRRQQQSGDYDEEYRVVRPDGEVRWIRDRAFPVRDAAGKIYRVAGIAEDITATRLAIKALQGSEQKFRDLLGNVQLASVMLDCEARIIFCNEFLLRLSGWTLAEVLGRNWFEIFLPTAAVEMKTRFGDYLASCPDSWHRENEIQTKAGLRRLLRWNNSILRTSEGTIAGSASIGEDITDQRLESIRLVESRQRLTLATQSARLGLWEWNVVSNEMLWDSQMHLLYGTAAADVSGRVSDWQSLIHPDDSQRVAAAVEAALSAEVEFHCEYRVVWTDGQVRDLESQAVVHRDGRGRATSITGVTWDVTDRKLASSRIKYLNRVRAMQSGIHGAIVRAEDPEHLLLTACEIATTEGEFIRASAKSYNAITGQLSPAFILPASAVDSGLHSGLLLATDQGEPSRLAAKAIACGRPVSLNYGDDAGDDQLNVLMKQFGVKSIAILPLSVGGATSALITLYASEFDFFHADEMELLSQLADDLSFALDHMDKAEKLNYLAYYDAVTGLANQSLFIERLNVTLTAPDATSRRKAVLVVDVEGFKTINDALGRKSGDVLLNMIAQRLVQVANDDERQLARVGPDRFAVVVSDMDDVGHVALLVEQTFDEIFAEPFAIGGEMLHISVKAGVSIFPDDGADAEILIRNAEAALKKVKTSTDRYLFYTQEMSTRISARLSLEKRLHKAVENEQFVIHYQPKFELVTGRMVGAEALIRWMDPLHGLIAPAVFIPILEQTGLIHEVGRWVLRSAMYDHKCWVRDGLGFVPIAVNVSPLQLRHGNFLSDVSGVLGGLGAVEAVPLELEITENVFMEDLDKNVTLLSTIRALGARIAIDDFGTGFSSLGYLSKLPIDTLKIDRSFVTDMQSGHAGLALVSTIINLAHSLKLNVVAEGVETDEQERLLRLLNCDELQGYLRGRGVPAEEFVRLHLGGASRS